jgi:hypothetical protein
MALPRLVRGIDRAITLNIELMQMARSSRPMTGLGRRRRVRIYFRWYEINPECFRRMPLDQSRAQNRGSDVSGVPGGFEPLP